MLTTLQISVGVAAALVGVVSWEHVCRINGILFKPSVGIRWAARVCGRFWNWMGKALAIASSFLTYLEGLGETIADLARPTIDLGTSFVHLVYGFAEQASTYKYPILITVGCLLAVGGVAFALHYFEYAATVRAFLSTHASSIGTALLIIVLGCLIRYFWPWRNILEDPQPEEEAASVSE